MEEENKEICSVMLVLYNRLELIFARSRQKSLCTASLDRINSNFGYIEGNVQWIHKLLNNTKNKMHNEDFINWCIKIADFCRGKNND